MRASRRLQDEQVAKDDARSGCLELTAELDRRHNVHAIAILQRAVEELVVVSGQLEGTKIALQLGPDPLFLRGAETAGRDLLAGVDRLDGDELVDLPRLRDRSRDDAPSRYVLHAQHVAVGHVGTWSSEGDVV